MNFPLRYQTGTETEPQKAIITPEIINKKMELLVRREIKQGKQEKPNTMNVITDKC